jgi:hypothetical protein
MGQRFSQESHQSRILGRCETWVASVLDDLHD